MARPLLRGMERLERPTHGRRVSETAMVLAQDKQSGCREEGFMNPQS